MFYRKSLLVMFLIFGLALWRVQDVGAWGTGGGVSTPYKTAFADLQLFCDLSDPRSHVDIITTPSNVAPNVRPSFKFSGKVVCAEVPSSISNPKLTDAITLTPASLGKAIGLFDLNQITDPALFPGLKYTQSTDASGTKRTWTFDVNGHESFPFAELLHELAPANLPNTDPLYSLAQQAQNFCDPAHLGVTGVQSILDPTNCKALFGLQLPIEASDYAANPALGLQSGQVFTFSTLTPPNGNETPIGSLAWAPCHTTRFIGPKTFPIVDALTYSSNINGSGVVTGSPLNTGIKNGTFFVTVEPNDLWNSGLITSGGPRWSNADGQTVNLFTDAIHNSYKTIDPVSGMNYLDQLDPEVQAFCTAHPAECPTGIPDKIGRPDSSPTGDGFTAAFGELVGRVGLGGVASNYHHLGTNGVVTLSGQPLELFYWDTTTEDNTGSVEVTVAEDSIQCTVPGHPDIPIVAKSELHGERKVQVVGWPELDVDSKFKLPFPVAVVGCSQGDEAAIQFSKNGSPILPDFVLVNGLEVDVKSFAVLNTVIPGFLNDVPKTCDPSKKLADLNLLLDYKDFNTAIKSVFSGGTCTDGPVDYTITFHDGNTPAGFFGGKGKVWLDCK